MKRGITRDNSVSGAYILKKDTPDVQMPVGVDGIKKKALNMMNKIIVPPASNAVLYEPLADNAWTLLQMDSSFGLRLYVSDYSVNLPQIYQTWADRHG